MIIGTITPRLIYLQDLATTDNPSGEKEPVNVMGETANPVMLDRIPLVLLTSFVQASDDDDAMSKGVPLGGLYYNTTTGKLHARIGPQAG